MKRIIWSPKAIDSINSLVSFIDKKWEAKIADNLLNEIDETVVQISHNPLLFQLYSERKNIRRCVIKKKTLLFYRVFSSEVHILLLVDARQNPKKYKF